MSDDPPVTCEYCDHCIAIDYGYSNWTVEGTTIGCMEGHHPDGEFDRWYGEDKRLAYAAQCDHFTPGDGIWIDVDGEDVADLSDRDRARYEKYLGLGGDELEGLVS